LLRGNFYWKTLRKDKEKIKKRKKEKERGKQINKEGRLRSLKGKIT